MAELKSMGKFRELLKLNWKFIGLSRRLAIVTIVGLSISVAMITQNIFFLNSFRNNAFDEFATNTTETYIEANVDGVRWPGSSLREILEANIRNQLSDAGFLQNQLQDQEWISYRFFYLLLINEKYGGAVEYHDTYIVGIDPTYLSLLSDLITEGRAPGTGEFCIITNSKTLEETNLALNDTFGAYIKLSETSTPRDSVNAHAGEMIEFAGIINLDNFTFGNLPIPDELQTLISMALGLGREIILTNFQKLPTLLAPIPFSLGEFSILGRFLFNLQQFDVFRLDEHIESMQIFVNNIQESIIDVVGTYSTNYDLALNSRILPLLVTFKTEFRMFQIILLVFMLPTLGMALTLTAFASNQIKKQRDLHVFKLHQRGASRQMLFGFMIFELLIFSLLAVLVGVLIGWPYTLIALKSDGFFSFTGSATIPSLQGNWLVIGLILSVGFGIAFLSNIFSLWRKTKTSVDEALQEHVEKKPFWERFYIDIFLLILGILMWLVSFTQIGGSTESAIEFAFYFAAPAPIFIIIGSIMFITRIYPTVIKGISDLIFKIPKLEISAVSARNAIRRKGSTSRTIILMTLTFTLTVASMVVPDSYESYDMEDSYYSLGADIVISGVDIQTPDFKNTILGFEGVEAATYVGILEIVNTESELTYAIKIMGVELDNFSKVAFQEPEYTDGRGVENLITSINNFTDVIAQKDVLELLNLGNNKTFVMQNWQVIGEDVVYATFGVLFVDQFDYWPTLYDRIPSATSKLINIGMLSNISLPFWIAREDSDVEGKLFVKVKEGYSISELADSIETNTFHETESIEEILMISEGSLKATVLFGALNTSFIISLFISSATLIIMMIVQGIEREKEIAVMKSFGIKPRQLFNFFISEAIIILIFTMIIGIGLGLGTSVMIMKVLRIGSLIPEHEMIFPIVKIIWTALAIFGAGLVSTIIPIIINSRKKIGGSLKSI